MIDTEPGQNARLEVEIQAFYSKIEGVGHNTHRKTMAWVSCIPSSTAQSKLLLWR